MTRDDAVKKAEECFQFNVPSQEWFFTPLRLVAALENLGMLKLDEPKSIKKRFADALWEERLPTEQIWKIIDRVGLKIVEK